MSNVIDSSSKSGFFPDKKVGGAKAKGPTLSRNNPLKKDELDKSSARDVKLDINDGIKEFSKIKKAVDASTPIDKADRIAELKESIKAGSYKIDPDKIADSMMANDF